MGAERPGKDWESWIDQTIREAQERGDFDNLPGKGKPLDLTPNPYAQDQELAFKILKDAGFAPEWIELDKAIRTKLDEARAALARARERYDERMRSLESQAEDWVAAERRRAEASWGDAVGLFKDQVSAINKQIAELNLKVPSPRFQRLRVDSDREISRLEAATHG